MNYQIDQDVVATSVYADKNVRKELFWRKVGVLGFFMSTTGMVVVVQLLSEPLSAIRFWTGCTALALSVCVIVASAWILAAKHAWSNSALIDATTNATLVLIHELNSVSIEELRAQLRKEYESFDR